VYKTLEFDFLMLVFTQNVTLYLLFRSPYICSFGRWLPEGSFG